jgi:hypothetical protein
LTSYIFIIALPPYHALAESVISHCILKKYYPSREKM